MAEPLEVYGGVLICSGAALCWLSGNAPEVVAFLTVMRLKAVNKNTQTISTKVCVCVGGGSAAGVDFNVVSYTFLVITFVLQYQPYVGLLLLVLKCFY